MICSFFGHRKIQDKERLICVLYGEVEKLIVNKNVDTFLFGSRSEFYDLCWQVISKLREKYPTIKRVLVRAEYGFINENYRYYLLERYEDTYFPKKCSRAGKLSYIIRNQVMIDESEYCLFYYREDYKPQLKEQPKRARSHLPPVQTKSGTKLAYIYAEQKNKIIIKI